MFRSPILILDEPTAGLDPESSEILKEKIQKELNNNRLIIVTSHIMSDLEDISTHLAYMHDGKIAFHNTISDLLIETNKKNLSQAVIGLMKNLSNVQNN